MQIAKLVKPQVTPTPARLVVCLEGHHAHASKARVSTPYVIQEPN